MLSSSILATQLIINIINSVNNNNNNNINNNNNNNNDNLNDNSMVMVMAMNTNSRAFKVRRRRRRRRAERKGKKMNCKNEFLEEKLRICAHSLTCAAHPGNEKVALKYVIFSDIFKRICTL